MRYFTPWAFNEAMNSSKSGDRIDPPRLQTAFERVIHRHDSFFSRHLVLPIAIIGRFGIGPVDLSQRPGTTSRVFDSADTWHECGHLTRRLLDDDVAHGHAAGNHGQHVLL